MSLECTSKYFSARLQSGEVLNFEALSFSEEVTAKQVLEEFSRRGLCRLTSTEESMFFHYCRQGIEIPYIIILKGRHATFVGGRGTEYRAFSGKYGVRCKFLGRCGE